MVITDTFNLFWKIKHQGASYDARLLIALLQDAGNPDQDDQLKEIHLKLRRFYDKDMTQEDWLDFVKIAGSLNDKFRSDTMLEILSAISDVLVYKNQEVKQNG